MSSSEADLRRSPYCQALEELDDVETHIFEMLVELCVGAVV